MNEGIPGHEIARAKVNLTLHVTGRRDDGYHVLDSLVVFPEIGDALTVTSAAALSLAIDGPFSDGLENGNNLVLRAARLLTSDQRGAALRLTKNLPVAGGIGGGSADAAAALRLLSRFWTTDLPPAERVLALGADVAVCLKSTAQRMGGIGGHLAPLCNLPPFWLVLANDGNKVATASVFSGLAGRLSAPMPDPLPDFRSTGDLAAFLRCQRNDLEDPASAIAPGIIQVLAALRLTRECLLARMSGSGGTCFAMFESEMAARRAQAELHATHPDWWTVAAPAQQTR